MDLFFPRHPGDPFSSVKETFLLFLGGRREREVRERREVKRKKEMKKEKNLQNHFHH